MFKRLDDLEELHFMINNGHLDMYISNVDQKRNTINSVKNRLLFFTKLVKDVYTVTTIKNNINTWLFYETKNNFDALLPLKTRNNIFVNPRKDIVYRYLLFYKLMFTVPLFFYLLIKNKLKWYFVYFDSLGVLEESRRILKKYKPKNIVFANDHNPYQVALRIEAQKQNITTFYLQHACVGMNMPPLNFDISFLDGLDALNKYKKIGNIQGRVELTGLIRSHSKSLIINKKEKVVSIGVALNMYDRIEDVKCIIDKILKIKQIEQIYIRLHPADDRIFLYNSDKIKYSNSKLESSFDFLAKIDLLIAGDSSIHLDAAIVNVLPIYYKFTKNKVFDIYEFVKNELVVYSKNDLELIDLLKKEVNVKSNAISRAAYYDEFIRTNVNYKKIIKKYDLI